MLNRKYFCAILHDIGVFDYGENDFGYGEHDLGYEEHEVMRFQNTSQHNKNPTSVPTEPVENDHQRKIVPSLDQPSKISPHQYNSVTLQKVPQFSLFVDGFPSKLNYANFGEHKLHLSQSSRNNRFNNRTSIIVQ